MAPPTEKNKAIARQLGLLQILICIQIVVKRKYQSYEEKQVEFYSLKEEERQMNKLKKWQIRLIAIFGSLAVLFLIGFIICELIF